MHGFPNWVSKMSFVIEGEDLLIKIPPILVTYGTAERISHSKRKAETDKFMRKLNYTYLEFVIKTACNIYAASLEKKVAVVGGFYKKRQ